MSEKYSYLKERLFKFSKQNGECLESTYKARTQSGYALVKFERSTRGAHRISWMIHHGDIPEGKWVLHKCDNPLCIRIDHLFLGTPMDNSLDMRNKGRENFEGAKKYDEKVVDEAIKMRKEGKTLKEIGEKFGISIPTIESFFKRTSRIEESKGFYGVPKYPEEIRNRAWEMCRNGVKNKDIIKILSIPKRSLLRILKKFRIIQNS
jgi:hypothetical protein